jgi:hypothetical protein
LDMLYPSTFICMHDMSYICRLMLQVNKLLMRVVSLVSSVYLIYSNYIDKIHWGSFKPITYKVSTLASNQVMLCLHPSNIMCHIIFHNNNFLKWFILLNDIHLKFCCHCCVLCDEMNKTRSRLHIFLEKN